MFILFQNPSKTALITFNAIKRLLDKDETNINIDKLQQLKSWWNALESHGPDLRYNPNGG